MRFAAPPQSVLHCHCGLCRRLSGAAFTTWASFARGGMTLAGEAAVSVCRITDNGLRHFCATCGTHVYTLDGRWPEIVGVPAGIVEGMAPLPAPKGHYFVDHRADWYTASDDLPRFGGPSGFEPVAS